MEREMKARLREAAEAEYGEFSRKLLPGVDGILGVRLPKLRKLAKEILKREWRTYLDITPQYVEETMLQGMLIGYAEVDQAERLTFIAGFVPKIDNWSVCDSFCGGLKFTKEYQARVWGFLQPYFQSGREFEIRFAVVMALNYYVNETYLHEVFKTLARIRHDGYYAKMAVAWAVSVCFMKYPQETLLFLQDECLDAFTYSKALQKITESYKVEKADKEEIRRMKKRFSARKKAEKGDAEKQSGNMSSPKK